MGQEGDHVQIIFDYFQIVRWMLQTGRVEKVDEKLRSFV